jgi:hypothetical protein
MTRVTLAVVLLLAAGCGADDNGGTIDSGASTTTASVGGPSVPAGDALAALTIEVSTGPGGLRSGTLTCGPGGEAVGTGHLGDEADAAAACLLVTGNEDARRRLLQGPAPDQICTEQYGGPEEARVTGTIDGEPVDAAINRIDGCAIADWDLLTPLLGLPGV